MDLEDISRGAEVGRENDNLGGTGIAIYAAEFPDVGEGNFWPSAPANFDEANVLDFASLDITAGDLYKIDVIQYSGEVRDEEVGETDGRAFRSEVEFALAKNNETNLGFLSTTSNARLVLIVPTNDGKFRILGNDKFPATRIQGSAKTNKKPGDAPAAGALQVWESYGPGPAMILDATLAEVEGLLTA